jgi:hypothetical protein
MKRLSEVAWSHGDVSSPLLPIHPFQDEAWVRAAALYWDQLGRIVPYGGYHYRDASSIAALREAGFIVEFEPEGADYPVSQAFESLVD